MNALADLLKSTRLQRRLTQTALARRAGVPQSTISRLESGAYKDVPGPEIVNPIAAALGLPERLLLEAIGYDLAEDGMEIDAELLPALALIRSWNPRQRRLLWEYIEAVTAALDERDPPVDDDDGDDQAAREIA